MTDKKRYSELNYFNAIACLFVILIHVLSYGITNLRADSLQGIIVYLPWRLAAYVVPGFIFSGAVKMALGFEKDTENGVKAYFAYVLRRITKIYLPYVLWVGVYYLYFLRLGWVEKGFDVFLRYVWFGDLSSPFYYVVTVMQFYLLAPLWRWCVKRIPFYIAIPISAFISVLMLNFEKILSAFEIEFLWRDRIFPTYLVFFVIGLYVGKHYESLRDAVKKQKLSFITLIIPVLLFVFLGCLQYTKGIYIFDQNPLKIFSDILMIFFMLALCIFISDSAPTILKKPLLFISSASFTVYLSHCLFLQECQNTLGEYGITDIGVTLVIRALVTYTLPFLLWYVWSIIRRLALKLISK